jgi:hypothetical protein
MFELCCITYLVFVGVVVYVVPAWNDLCIAANFSCPTTTSFLTCAEFIAADSQGAAKGGMGL